MQMQLATSQVTSTWYSGERLEGQLGSAETNTLYNMRHAGLTTSKNGRLQMRPLVTSRSGHPGHSWASWTILGAAARKLSRTYPAAVRQAPGHGYHPGIPQPPDCTPRVAGAASQASWPGSSGKSYSPGRIRLVCWLGSFLQGQPYKAYNDLRSWTIRTNRS